LAGAENASCGAAGVVPAEAGLLPKLKLHVSMLVGRDQRTRDVQRHRGQGVDEQVGNTQRCVAAERQWDEGFARLSRVEEEGASNLKAPNRWLACLTSIIVYSPPVDAPVPRNVEPAVTSSRSIAQARLRPPLRRVIDRRAAQHLVASVTEKPLYPPYPLVNRLSSCRPTSTSASLNSSSKA
jgi:hypothetical protein